MFITTNTLDRKKIFADPANAREVIDVLYRVQELHPFFLYSFVIMPNHVHLLMSVPDGGSISKIINRFKMGVSHSLGQGPIWQPRFYMKLVGNLWNVTRYIHRNPVKAGLTKNPEDYPWSSAGGKWDVTDTSLW